MKKHYDTIIVGSGPAGLGTAFHLADTTAQSILLIDKAKISSGGLRNDCKQNYTFPVGFPQALWTEEEAGALLPFVAEHLKPHYQAHTNIDIYRKRAEKLGAQLLQIQQAHVGTDKAVGLIRSLVSRLKTKGVQVSLGAETLTINPKRRTIRTNRSASQSYINLVLAPGRAGAKWLQKQMNDLKVEYVDNTVDVGLRVEMRQENYSIVNDYYDPKFLFPDTVRTFCTNSGAAHVVQEKYDTYFSVNGHSYSKGQKSSGLVNFAMLKTIHLTDPVVSGHQFAEILGQMAMQISGNKPMMQRVGDFRLGKRSKLASFNDDLYDFKPTLRTATPGDISLAAPAKILRDVWKSLKMLDTIVPGVLHPSTILYYPEIKTYANRPQFQDAHFRVADGIYMIGDGAGTSRGITAAWASGIRAAQGIAKTT